MAYWEFQPTIDHVVPVTMGGKDSEDNWVTTSMINNSIKNNFSLEQLGWKIYENGDIKEWDGLSGKFLYIIESDASLLNVLRIKQWYNVTKTMFIEYGLR